MNQFIPSIISTPIPPPTISITQISGILLATLFVQRTALVDIWARVVLDISGVAWWGWMGWGEMDGSMIIMHGGD